MHGENRCIRVWHIIADHIPPARGEPKSLELQPTESIERSSKVESHPFRDIEASGSEYASIDGNVLTEVGEGCPGYVVGDAVFVVPLSYSGKCRKEHVHIEEPASSSQMQREWLPLTTW